MEVVPSTIGMVRILRDDQDGGGNNNRKDEIIGNNHHSRWYFGYWRCHNAAGNLTKSQGDDEKKFKSHYGVLVY